MVLAVDILTEALIGSPASPLRKALIDSGLGEDLTGVSDWGFRQLLFSTGLKGVDVADADKVEPLILATLQTLADEGLSQATIEAAVNTIEFALRENSGFEGQRGISMMINALSMWLHDQDPLAMLAFEEPLRRVKAQIEENPRFFADLIRSLLLNNPHRGTVILRPDPELQQRADAGEAARLAATEDTLSEADRQAIAESTLTLRAIQNRPDSPEALATIPTMNRSDLDQEIQMIPLQIEETAGSRVLLHPLDTNGIVYLDLGLDLHLLPQDLLPYASLFGRTLLEMGTQTEDFVQLSQRIGRTTGGIEPDTFVSAAHGQRPHPAWIFLRGKATADNAGDLLAILSDILLGANLNNQTRFRQLVSEEKARAESAVLDQGSRMASQRLAAHFAASAWVNDRLNFLGNLFFLRGLQQEVETDWTGVLAKLEATRRYLVNRTAMIANVTVDGEHWATVQSPLADFLQALPSAAAASTAWQPEAMSANEGFTIPAQVNYVGKGADLYAHGYQIDGSALVVNHYLNTSYLWDKIRVQGGAYGGYSVFDRLTGIYSFVSYRDPNLEQTLETYDGAIDFLRSLALNEEELSKGIVGTVKNLEPYELPDAKGYTSLHRYLVGETDAYRQQLRDEVLATTPAHFRQFADALEAVKNEGHVVVLAGAERLSAFSQSHGADWMTIQRAL